MRFFTDLSELYSTSLSPSVATIGFFDGVHCGHKFLIHQVCEAARVRRLSSLLITFPSHPRMVMQTDYQPRLLSSFDEFVGHEILSERDLQDYLGRYQDLRDEWRGS